MGVRLVPTDTMNGCGIFSCHRWGGILWDNRFFNPAFLFVVAYTPAEQFKISKDGKDKRRKVIQSNSHVLMEEEIAERWLL